jgi:hypothetical protein
MGERDNGNTACGLMSRSRRNLLSDNRTWDGKLNRTAIIEGAETILALQRLVDRSEAAVCDDFTPFPEGRGRYCLSLKPRVRMDPSCIPGATVFDRQTPSFLPGVHLKDHLGPLTP